MAVVPAATAKRTTQRRRQWPRKRQHNAGYQLIRTRYRVTSDMYKPPCEMHEIPSDMHKIPHDTHEIPGDMHKIHGEVHELPDDIHEAPKDSEIPKDCDPWNSREALEALIWALPLPEDIPKVVCMICSNKGLFAFIERVKAWTYRGDAAMGEEDTEEDTEEEAEEEGEEDEEWEAEEDEDVEDEHNQMRIALKLTGDALVRAYETKGDLDEVCWALGEAFDAGTYKVRNKEFNDEELETLRWIRRNLEDDKQTKRDVPCSTVPHDFAGGVRR